MTKKEIRQNLFNLREKLNKNIKKNYDDQIIQKIENNLFFQNSNIILSFMPINNEIDVLKLFFKYKNYKTFAFPICRNKNMNFYSFNKTTINKITYENHNNFFDIDKFGIKIPKLEYSFQINYDNYFIIIPMLGFFENLHRIGYGGGYYDKFLKNNKSFKCGIAYDFQKIENQYSNLIYKTDIELDIIITQNNIYNK